MDKASLNYLRILSLSEGLSYLLLLAIGMPLKYALHIPLPNKLLGMGHGILTLIFVATLYLTWLKKEISFRLAIIVFIASLLPFGAFYVDRYLKR